MKISTISRDMVDQRFVACDEIWMARPTVLTERGDLPSGTTVLVMGVPAHMDHRFADTAPLFAVVQICHQTIRVDGVILGHDWFLSEKYKGDVREAHRPYRSVRLPRISVLEEGRVPHEGHAGVALRAQGTKLDDSILIVATTADARRWLGDGHLTATIAWDQTASHGVETTETIVLDFVNHLLEYG